MASRRVAVVTGASSGVGRATVRRFAQKGADLALIARGRDGLEAAAKEVEALGARALVLPLDLADEDDVEAAAAKTEQVLGPIDVWVNNAMTSVFAPLKEITAAEFRRVTEVTYLGTVYGTMTALRRMLPRDEGSIVQVGSALAYRAIPLQSAYCGAKHAIKGFTESLRCELLHDKSNVRVTMVQLPALNTPQFHLVESKLPNEAQPVPPIYQPEVAARAIEWASRHRRREVWAGGSAVATLLGQKLMAGVLDRYLGRTGYRAQQTDRPRDPSRPSNLWEPVPGDHGAHGSFDDRAHAHSVELSVALHRRALGAAAAGAAAVGMRVARED